VITSVDREGTGLGYDINLIQKVSSVVSIPVVACGGGGKPEHVAHAINDGGADAIALASMLHYDYIAKNAMKGDFSNEGNIEFLKKRSSFAKINPNSISSIKKEMIRAGIPTRCTRMEE